jgi:hypothetical protein
VDSHGNVFASGIFGERLGSTTYRTVEFPTGQKGCVRLNGRYGSLATTESGDLVLSTGVVDSSDWVYAYAPPRFRRNIAVADLSSVTRTNVIALTRHDRAIWINDEQSQFHQKLMMFRYATGGAAIRRIPVSGEILSVAVTPNS